MTSLRFFPPGGGDDTEEWRHGGHGVGGKHSLLGDGLQHRCLVAGQRRTSLVNASQPGVLSPWLHVHNILWLHYLRELDTKAGRQTSLTHALHEVPAMVPELSAWGATGSRSRSPGHAIESVC